MDYAEALRLIRKYMQPGDTVGMMFMRVAKTLETKEAECEALRKSNETWVAHFGPPANQRLKT